ncbi:MAG: radical SAM protein [Dehalococcoidia bacterium]|nr:radical SAM protein [Dehalococcoidia bacterium]
MRVVLASTYELGHQPLGLAAPAAALRAHGHEVRCLDLAVEPFDRALFEGAGLVGVSMPMHTAARLGIALAASVRRIAPAAHLCAYGLYASALHAQLTGDDAPAFDSAIGGEYEPALCELADRLAAGRYDHAAPSPGTGALPAFERQRYPLPDRAALPPLELYARADTGREGDEQRLAGYVEATRGCAHTCRHCPITPVYGGRLRLVQRETVLADIDQQVAAGARHITFGDPDFLNAVPHSLALVDALAGRHPGVSFDVTTKVEHLLEHAALLPRLRDAGCLFITSAFESCDDRVLRLLDKGHTRADMERALALAAGAGIPLRPTWVAFTPWSDVDGFLELLRFIEQHGLVGHVQPVQYALRLLLPPGSPLVPLLREQGLLLDAFDAAALTYRWRNADPRIDALSARMQAIVEQAASPPAPLPRGEGLRGEGPALIQFGSFGSLDAVPAAGTANVAVFERVKRAALNALGRHGEPSAVAPQPRVAVPRLTEDWFCCAEPTTAQLAPLNRAVMV